MATPIGNLEDITLRALRVLREVSMIAAEDTRHSGRLLKHFDIDTPLLSFHEHSDPARLTAILDTLNRGDVALISDAGTPGISDPGHVLVRAAFEHGHQISPIPGPTAAVAAVSVSGLVPDGFLFLGFLPRRQHERRAVVGQVRDLPYPLVIYEAPHRLLRCLVDLEHELGDRPLTVARELTKLHEEIFRAKISAARARYDRERPRGEFVLVVDRAPDASETVEIDSAEVLALLARRIEAGDSASAAARHVARQTGLPRSGLYARTREIERAIDQS